MTKSELRIKYKAFRQLLDTADIDAKSLLIANMCLKLPVWHSQTFHIFLPIEAQHEVNTEFLLHILAGKDKKIVLSKSDFQSREMLHFLLDDHTIIIMNKYGIPEPVNGQPVEATSLDVVFIPLLAFDLEGNRVGYGKGFYDKFLAGCRSETIKIGLSFFDAENSCSDVFESDVKLDYCVTPERIYTF